MAIFQSRSKGPPFWGDSMFSVVCFILFGKGAQKKKRKPVSFSLKKTLRISDPRFVQARYHPHPQSLGKVFCLFAHERCRFFTHRIHGTIVNLPKNDPRKINPKVGKYSSVMDLSCRCPCFFKGGFWDEWFLRQKNKKGWRIDLKIG